MLGAGAGPTRGVRIGAGFELQDQVKPSHLHIHKLDSPCLSMPVSFYFLQHSNFLTLAAKVSINVADYMLGLDSLPLLYFAFLDKKF